MIGSMGLASSIGLGVAIKNPDKNIYVFDGDGNILMNFRIISHNWIFETKKFYSYHF